eukprot:Nitzschia sp. Nitz4//scaffold36_size144017//66891//68390//NITZ4_003092-RA/size144017-processed-gene-0.45-mRNA-1//1//CDS//3329549474//3622//frame0
MGFFGRKGTDQSSTAAPPKPRRGLAPLGRRLGRKSADKQNATSPTNTSQPLLATGKRAATATSPSSQARAMTTQPPQYRPPPAQQPQQQQLQQQQAVSRPQAATTATAATAYPKSDRIDNIQSTDSEGGLPSRYDAASLDVSDNNTASIQPKVSEMTSYSYAESTTGHLSGTFSEDYHSKSVESSLRNGTFMSASSRESGTYVEHSHISPRHKYSQDDDGLWSEAETVTILRQKIAWFSIVLSAVQLGVLIIQLSLCGVAPIEVNPLVGPFPDAFSEWGGKNAYLLLDGRQFYRLVTPTLLSVGVVHLLVNVFCQLETCAYFEREWGTFKYICIYLLCGAAAVASSVAENPDEIGVASSGALMGLYGAKLSQIFAYNCFEVRHPLYAESVQGDRLGGIFLSSAMLFILSTLVDYIDLSGLVGALLVGFCAGMFLLSGPIASTCANVLWSLVGMAAFSALATILFLYLYMATTPDEDLADACQYYRLMYTEGYNCDCAWN